MARPGSLALARWPYPLGSPAAAPRPGSLALARWPYPLGSPAAAPRPGSLALARWPHPLGSPAAAPRPSFEILRLLAQLREQRFGGDHGLGDLEVVGFGSHRVHLAVRLLEEEVERSPDQPPIAEQ